MRFAIILTVLSLAGTAAADLYYYTFEGDIYDTSQDAAGAVANAGLTVGDTVSYTFVIDLDASGYVEKYDGTTLTYSDNALRDYFYVDLVDGDYLTSINPPADTADDYHFGFDALSSGATMLNAESKADMVCLSLSSGDAVPDWYETQTGFALTEQATDSLEDISSISAIMTLTRISDTYPPSTVPVPGAALLGVLGLGTTGWCLRGRKSQA